VQLQYNTLGVKCVVELPLSKRDEAAVLDLAAPPPVD
jgi:hypothetical protein